MEGWGAGRADETVKEEEVRDRMELGWGKEGAGRPLKPPCSECLLLDARGNY